MEPSPRRRGAWDCLDHAQGQSLSSSTDGLFPGLLDIVGQFRDLLPLPPWSHLAASVTAVHTRTGQHNVVGNVCCPNTPSSETAANGMVDQPELDLAHHCSDHSRLGTVSKGEPTQAKQDSLSAQKSGFLPSLQDCRRVPTWMAAASTTAAATNSPITPGRPAPPDLSRGLQSPAGGCRGQTTAPRHSIPS